MERRTVYVEPVMQVIEMEFNNPILAGSTEGSVTGTITGRSDDSEDGDYTWD